MTGYLFEAHHLLMLALLVCSLAIKTVLMSRIKDDYEVNTTSKPTLVTLIRIKVSGGGGCAHQNWVMARKTA